MKAIVLHCVVVYFVSCSQTIDGNELVNDVRINDDLTYTNDISFNPTFDINSVMAVQLEKIVGIDEKLNELASRFQQGVKKIDDANSQMKRLNGIIEKLVIQTNEAEERDKIIYFQLEAFRIKTDNFASELLQLLRNIYNHALKVENEELRDVTFKINMMTPKIDNLVSQMKDVTTKDEILIAKLIDITTNLELMSKKYDNITAKLIDNTVTVDSDHSLGRNVIDMDSEEGISTKRSNVDTSTMTPLQNMGISILDRQMACPHNHDDRLLDSRSSEEVKSMRRSMTDELQYFSEDGVYNGTFTLYRDWMIDLPDSHSLTQLTLPGTHDSMALFGGNQTECQNLPLYTQLEYGIRVLEIRCRHVNDFCLIYRNEIYQNSTLDDVFNDVTRFLQLYPSEAILLKLGEEPNPMDNNQSLIETIKLYLRREEMKNYIWRGGDRIPTLGEVRGKIVILDQIGNGQLGLDWYKCGICNGSCSSPCIQDQFNVSSISPCDIRRKWDYVLCYMSQINSGDRNQLFFNVLSGWSDNAHPNAVAEKINTLFLEQMRSNPILYSRLGILMMDFPNAEQIMRIINVNFKDRGLEVQLYEHGDQKGKTKIFSLQSKDCVYFDNWNNILSSLNTFGNGKCVRLWENTKCTGSHLNVTMRMNSCVAFLGYCNEDWNDKVSSMSPC